MKFRKKPVEIDAIQFNDTNKAEIEKSWPEVKFHADPFGDGWWYIKILEDVGIVEYNDWIIRGVVNPCKPDIFDDLYEKIDGIDSVVV
jgi:hypothetical protein